MLSERLAGSSVVTQAEGGTPPVTTSERQSRIFYGWYIVLGALVAQFVAVGIQAGVSGVFLRPMTEDLGWTRAEFTIATSLGTGVSGMIGFFIGGYVDRVGARPLMVVGVTIVGATLLAISRVEELWRFVVLRGVLFTVGFVLVGNLVVNVTLSKWFVDRRGWAISLASLGTSAAAIVTPLVMVRVVDTLGWRDGWVVMGLSAWALIYPVALIMRRQPEDQGLLPDGRVEGRAGDEAGVERARLDYANSYTRGEAVRTLSMWLLILAFGFAMVGLISLLFHTIPFLTDNGYTRTDAAIVSASMGGSALVSKFAWRWVMQRFHPRVLAAASFVIAGVSVLSMVPIAASGSVVLMFAAFMAWGGRRRDDPAQRVHLGVVSMAGATSGRCVAPVCRARSSLVQRGPTSLAHTSTPSARTTARWSPSRCSGSWQRSWSCSLGSRSRRSPRPQQSPPSPLAVLLASSRDVRPWRSPSRALSCPVDATTWAATTTNSPYATTCTSSSTRMHRSHGTSERSVLACALARWAAHARALPRAGESDRCRR
jgi:MFS family permease